MSTYHAPGVGIKIVSADVTGVIKKLSERGISLYDLQTDDELTARFFVVSSDYKSATDYLSKWGVETIVLEQQSDLVSSFFKKGRLLFLAGLLLIFLLSVILSGRILFIQIEGNEKVPAQRIMEVASDCGIKFWSKGRQIRSEKMKNQLLEDIPELQWAGVNTSGCVAVIKVEEKESSAKPNETKGYVTSIVASSDGVVDSITVTSGNPMCRVGQAVKEGQTLISGYLDCGLVIKAQQASGEVFARTLHNITAVSPQKWVCRADSETKTVRHSLKIGKKLINFDKGSGISPATCVKMYEERYLTLPGGFSLPVSWVTRTIVPYETEVSEIATSQCFCQQEAEKYLLSQLVAGQILHSNVDYRQSGDCAVLSGQYLCSEMIGRTRIEQSVQGETNSD